MVCSLECKTIRNLHPIYHHHHLFFLHPNSSVYAAQLKYAAHRT